MLKKLMCCLGLLLVLVSSAYASEPFLWGCHASIAGMTDGKADYSNARFYALYLQMQQDETTATEEHMSLEGSMTLSGGNYSLINDGILQAASGTSQTFTLIPDMTPGDEGVTYVPADSQGRRVYFLKDADSGLKGITASWNFPDMPSLNGQGTIPNFRTTQEQLDNFVPYIEYIRSGSDVTGLTWRIVDPSDTSTAVTQNYRMRFRVRSIANYWGINIYGGEWVNIPAGDAAEGTIEFPEPIPEADIGMLQVRVSTHENEDTNIYRWNFLTHTNLPPDIDSTYTAAASLVNGKADYRNVTSGIYDIPLKAEGVNLEADHFTSEGYITIAGGGYNVVYPDTFEILETVPEGTVKNFSLRMLDEITFTARDMEYMLVNEAGERILLADDKDSALAGSNISWTFPESLNMNGDRVLPNYKSVSEQLEQGAPYVELVSSDGNVTAINYKLVNANTGEEVSPSNRIDTLLTLERISSYPFELDWQVNTHSGTWTLDEPVAVGDIAELDVELRNYEDEEEDNYCAYKWRFLPSSGEDINPESPDVNPVPVESPDVQPVESPDVPPANNLGGSGGGCSAGLPLAALALAVSLFLTKKR